MLPTCPSQAGVLLLIAGVVQLIMGVIVVVQLIMLLNEVHTYEMLYGMLYVCASHVHCMCTPELHVCMRAACAHTSRGHARAATAKTANPDPNLTLTITLTLT